MKEYVDEKFWRMFSGFVTLLVVSVIFLIAIKIHKNSKSVPVETTASVINYNQ
ncbi:MAG: hypothetical protein NTV02_01150 [Candidatus Zambryskibacteria bacterium]|jgi:hypothetical protein|nr:hypothetical protein [Candidatus Zambryskibacteria bacterium]